MEHNKSIYKKLIPVLVVLVCLSLFYSLVRSRVALSEKQQELAAAQAALDDQLAMNEELNRTLAAGEDAIIERAAREQGYAKPNERIIIDISGK